ncbi:HupE/UreJ family protein [Nocardioides plantarum]|uniref:HupE/UreJ family protein n=1 Tax=Nocardioides plantarum TaxID=29299 RepID=A0ABV5KFL8_9ACTN|nr:HupE/UreJ family protein [Nocardioides plantarum]
MAVVLRRCSAGVLLLLLVLALVLAGGRAEAHGFSSVVYADVTSPQSGTVRVALELEYDLLVVSAADAQGDDDLFEEGDGAWQDGDLPGQVRALRDHSSTVLDYVTARFTVTADGRSCTPALHGDYTVGLRDVPYAHLTLDYTCPQADEHEIATSLFPDSEGYVKGTKAVVTYDLDLREGSAALDPERPSFSTHQTTAERFWDFFRLGAEHLLGGLDHLLFLAALIVGSRRLREVVLAASAFTLAHSVTFVLAALGLVTVPAGLVEPVIALSIAVVAGWHLVALVRRGRSATDLDTSSSSHLSLDRSGWGRLAVVFSFGLVHGLGFAGALGIDAAWSWTLLWSLLVFNIGIETVQLGLIVVTFPLLVLVRRRSPTAALWLTGTVAAVVTVMGLIWFVQRVAAS